MILKIRLQSLKNTLLKKRQKTKSLEILSLATWWKRSKSKSTLNFKTWYLTMELFKLQKQQITPFSQHFLQYHQISHQKENNQPLFLQWFLLTMEHQQFQIVLIQQIAFNTETIECSWAPDSYKIIECKWVKNITTNFKIHISNM